MYELESRVYAKIKMPGPDEESSNFDKKHEEKIKDEPKDGEMSDNEDPASPAPSTLSEGDQDRGDDGFPVMAGFLFGNIDSEGKLTDDNDFFDPQSKAKLAGLSALLGNDSVGSLLEVQGDKEQEKQQTLSNTDTSEPFVEGQKADDAQDFSNMDEVMTDESSSESDESVDEVQTDNKTAVRSASPIESEILKEPQIADPAEHNTENGERKIKTETDNSLATPIKQEHESDSRLMPPPPGPGLMGKATANTPPKAADTNKAEKKEEPAVPVVKPLAAMLPDKYKGVDVRTLFPEFRENKTLRFTRLFPVRPQNKPKIWKNVKRRFALAGDGN